MQSVLENDVASSAIERILEVFGMMKDRDSAALAVARESVTEHISEMVASGQTDQERLVVLGLTRLKLLEMTSEGEA